MPTNAEDVLEPVLRDMKTTGVPSPRVVYTREDEPHLWLALLTAADGSGQGIYIDLSIPREELICSVADSAQEWAIENLQRASRTNWPQCPLHPENHPLKAVLSAGTPTWACPSNNTAIAEIGALAEHFLPRTCVD